jgi:hypothetical protein
LLVSFELVSMCCSCLASYACVCLKLSLASFGLLPDCVELFTSTAAQ